LLEHHEDTDVEQKWDDIKKCITNNSRRKLREDKSYTQKEILKDFG